MATYFLAPSLEKLRSEVNERFPKRDKSSDGWIGDPSHAARKSDHNPDWDARGRREGVVRALDIDIDDRDPSRDLRRELLNELIGDPRVWYVISNAIIYSRTYGFTARRYTGSNPHFAHVHVSLAHSEAAEFNTTRWFAAPTKTRTVPPAVNLAAVRAQFLAARNEQRVTADASVRRVQLALNRRYDMGLTADGYAGRATLNAYRFHERKVGVVGAPRIPDLKTLPLLVVPYYRVTGI